jgi:cysteine-rich repeat protein
VVYQVEFKDEVTLDLQLVGTDFMPALSIRQGACQAERYEDLCMSTEDIVLRAKLAMAPGIYWFVVDSVDGRAGNFWFALTTAKPACGDGVVNPRTEECDVGPGRPNDGCYDPGDTLGCMYGEKSDPAGQTP